MQRLNHLCAALQLAVHHEQILKNALITSVTPFLYTVIVSVVHPSRGSQFKYYHDIKLKYLPSCKFCACRHCVVSFSPDTWGVS